MTFNMHMTEKFEPLHADSYEENSSQPPPELPIHCIPTQPPLSFPGGLVNFAQRLIRFDDGHCVPLAERELQLLEYFARHPGQTISRDEILLSVWGLHPERVTTRTVDVHIAKLRHKLGETAAHPRLLFTVHGEGYIFLPSL